MHDPINNTLTALLESRKPSRHRFFKVLAEVPTDALTASGALDELYTRYQAAMHATRVMVYFLPHLDSIDLRIKKIRVIADDDLGPDGDTHHFQLRRTWTQLLGREPRMPDQAFGELTELTNRVDPKTAGFIRSARALYPRSLGPWVVIEGLAHDWIGALMKSLTVHFPTVSSFDYFQMNFDSCVELRHREESFNVVASVVADRPELWNETLVGATEMLQSLDALWDGFAELVDGIRSPPRL